MKFTNGCGAKLDVIAGANTLRLGIGQSGEIDGSLGFDLVYPNARASLMPISSADIVIVAADVDGFVYLKPTDSIEYCFADTSGYVTCQTSTLAFPKSDVIATDAAPVTMPVADESEDATASSGHYWLLIFIFVLALVMLAVGAIYCGWRLWS